MGRLALSICPATSRRKFVDRNGVLRRFINEQDFASRMGIHPRTVRRWIAAGKLSESNGLVRGVHRNFVDTKKCLLKLRHIAARAA
jgi:hypothetical protein